ncbi:hypothetical protein NDU88_007178 [Pleurodeles waltl]|uniref:Endonuclease/exonuclease/phosphatase domain-containing protein n=1 Tax=Pleurodeles waltl TaxID=8319 RepID=A0AAV7QR44_PLEWA|nr:hypothetical protein NDU88_007178 [Pleurodeles waltl]
MCASSMIAPKETDLRDREHLSQENSAASLRKGLNNRLISLQLSLKGKRHANFISAYASTLTNPEEIKDMFYEDLETLIASVPKEDKLIILGDFNARVGADYKTWEGVIRRNGVSKSNGNGHLLLKTSAAHDLLITNTVFCLTNCNKASRMHPCRKHWHIIDYVIVKRRDRQDVRVTKAICGADCWTDHRLILSKLNMHIQPRQHQQGKKTNRPLNVSKKERHQNLSEDLNSKLDQISFGTNGAEEDSAAFRDVVYNTVLAHLDQNKCEHQDWFDGNEEDIQKLPGEKREASRFLQQDTTSVSKKAAYNSIKSKPLRDAGLLAQQKGR